MAIATENQKKAREAMIIANLRTQRKLKPLGVKKTITVYPKGAKKKIMSEEMCKAMEEKGLSKTCKTKGKAAIKPKPTKKSCCTFEKGKLWQKNSKKENFSKA